MDASRFDALTRFFGRTASRRRALAGAVAAVIPVTAAAAKPEPAACLAVGKRCSQKAAAGASHGTGKGGKGKHHPPSCAKCCSRYGAAGSDGKARCACKSEGIACGNPAECCSGQCRDDVCTACPPNTVFCPDGCADLQTDDNDCGACGNACASGQRCQAGSCVCDDRSCPDGCCAGASCKRGTSAGACGAGGTTCATCQAPQVCYKQACCTPNCDGKCGGADDGCGGTCTVCPDECQTCDNGVCKNADDGTPCGGTDSGLRCCNGTCPPSPTCTPTGTCCPFGDDEAACEAACCASNTPGGSRCGFNITCTVSLPGERCHVDDDCAPGGAGTAICRCNVCCTTAGGGCGSPDECCSGACDSGICA